MSSYTGAGLTENEQETRNASGYCKKEVKVAREIDYKEMWERLYNDVDFWIKTKAWPIDPIVLRDMMDLIKEIFNGQAKNRGNTRETPDP